VGLRRPDRALLVAITKCEEFGEFLLNVCLVKRDLLNCWHTRLERRTEVVKCRATGDEFALFFESSGAFHTSRVESPNDFSSLRVISGISFPSKLELSFEVFSSEARLVVLLQTVPA
jgi:hypothetical protein